MLQPPVQSVTNKLSADDFAKSFINKVANASISALTTTPATPVIITAVPPLTDFEPITISQIYAARPISLPAKSSSLDSIATSWLLKRIPATISSILSHSCHLSLQHAIFPNQLKQPQVTPHLKKPTLDSDTANSYRPINNVSTSHLKSDSVAFNQTVSSVVRPFWN